MNGQNIAFWFAHALPHDIQKSDAAHSDNFAKTLPTVS
jgi:hypothetical protein